MEFNPAANHKRPNNVVNRAHDGGTPHNQDDSFPEMAGSDEVHGGGQPDQHGSYERNERADRCGQAQEQRGRHAQHRQGGPGQQALGEADSQNAVEVGDDTIADSPQQAQRLVAAQGQDRNDVVDRCISIAEQEEQNQEGQDCVASESRQSSDEVRPRRQQYLADLTGKIVEGFLHAQLFQVHIFSEPAQRALLLFAEVSDCSPFLGAAIAEIASGFDQLPAGGRGNEHGR